MEGVGNNRFLTYILFTQFAVFLFVTQVQTELVPFVTCAGFEHSAFEVQGVTVYPEVIDWHQDQFTIVTYINLPEEYPVRDLRVHYHIVYSDGTRYENFPFCDVAVQHCTDRAQDSGPYVMEYTRQPEEAQPLKVKFLIHGPYIQSMQYVCIDFPLYTQLRQLAQE